MIEYDLYRFLLDVCRSGHSNSHIFILRIKTQKLFLWAPWDHVKDVGFQRTHQQISNWLLILSGYFHRKEESKDETRNPHFSSIYDV